MWGSQCGGMKEKDTKKAANTMLLRWPPEVDSKNAFTLGWGYWASSMMSRPRVELREMRESCAWICEVM